jgi:ubiquinol-cytochrome c reductase cytochrome c1 subunit
MILEIKKDTIKIMHKIIFTIITIFLSFGICANTHQLPPKKMDWPFEGFLGKFDRQAAQRGFQVYKEVCSACHGLKMLSYRNLKELGFTEDEVKQIASEHMVTDGPNDRGEMFERPAIPSDMIKGPFANDDAARASNNGALPPDLSLIIKARHDGADYVYSLITGYHEAPKDFPLMTGLNYNPYFPGSQIAMAAPLSMEGQVTYIDGTRATVDQMAHDVVVFLQWAAEPEMEHRKSMGVKTMIYLSIFTLLFYFAKQKIWSRVK